MKMTCGVCKKDFVTSDPHRITCSWKCRNIRLSKKMSGMTFSDEHKLNIKKNHHDVKGKNNPRWKGGIRKVRGYILVWKPEHPNCNNHGYVQEHRLVMENKIGRYLNKSEIVHHINGIKSDNAVENLILLNQSEHTRLHGLLKGKKRSKEVTCFGCGKTFLKEMCRIDTVKSKRDFCNRNCYLNFRWHK